jgi:selenocysteine lyase/cysteine desulfurase
MNMHGIALLNASVGFILELGVKNVERHVLGLEKRLRKGLEKTAFDVLSFEDERRYSGLTVLYYPEEHFEAINERIEKAGVYLTHHRGYIRLAMGIHNTEKDADAVADLLCRISREVIERG